MTCIEDPSTLVRWAVDESPFSWGRSDAFGTAAYWCQAAGARPQCGRRIDQASRVEVVTREAAWCVLGGYGITAESATLAFDALNSRGLIRTADPPREEELYAVLSQPLGVQGARYRFPRQKSVRVADVLRSVPARAGATHRALRERLLEVRGIGPKTASWIVRNIDDCDEVAIIDVHIARAGLYAGVFSLDWTLPRDYDKFERAFLRWAAWGNVRPSQLDITIWDAMRRLGAARDLITRRAKLETYD